jgi:hypothetical protein
MIKAIASEKKVDIVVTRRNGSDGIVTVDYTTEVLNDEGGHNAKIDVDFLPNSGTLQFEKGETEKTITVEILLKDEGIERDETFGVVLSNISPAGAKLSKKCNQVINIVTDSEAKRKQEALA